jgi:hypothetical protein
VPPAVLEGVGERPGEAERAGLGDAGVGASRLVAVPAVALDLVPAPTTALPLALRGVVLLTARPRPRPTLPPRAGLDGGLPRVDLAAADAGPRTLPLPLPFALPFALPLPLALRALGVGVGATGDGGSSCPSSRARDPMP